MAVSSTNQRSGFDPGNRIQKIQSYLVIVEIGCVCKYVLGLPMRRIKNLGNEVYFTIHRQFSHFYSQLSFKPLFLMIRCINSSVCVRVKYLVEIKSSSLWCGMIFYRGWSSFRELIWMRLMERFFHDERRTAFRRSGACFLVVFTIAVTRKMRIQLR